MSLVYYYSPMSSAVRVTWAIEELDVVCERVLVDFRKGETKTPDFLKLNPNGKVPLLIVDGHPIFESLAILVYLGETYGVSGVSTSATKYNGGALTSPLVPADGDAVSLFLETTTTFTLYSVGYRLIPNV